MGAAEVERITPQPHKIKLGRAAFLGLAGVTGAYLVVGGKLPKFSALNLTGGTNVNGFTIYTIAGYPTFDPRTYRLTIDGLVDKPREYTYHDLLSCRPLSKHDTTSA